MELKKYDFTVFLEEIKKHKSWAILLAIFLLGFSMRYATHHDLLFDPDSYLWYRLGEYYAGIDKGYIVEENGHLVDKLSYHPFGRWVDKELFVLPMTLGYSYKILRILGIDYDMFQHMFIMGPFFGGLTAVAAYFVVKELTSAKVGFYSAAFYSITSHAFTRNTAGDTGQESIGGLLIFLWIFLFLKAIKEKPYSRNHLVLSFSSGIIMAFAEMAWGGNIFYLGLLISSFLIYFLYIVVKNKIEDTRVFESLTVTFVVVVLIGNMLPSALVPLRFPFPPHGLPIFYYSSVFLVGSVVVGTKYFKKVSPLNLLISVLGIFVVLAAVSGKLGFLLDILRITYNSIMGSSGKGITGDTVAYYRTTGYNELKSTFGILTAPIPLGTAYFLYKFYRKPEFNHIFLVVWMFLGIIAFRFMVRLSFYLALILPVMFFVLLEAYLTYEKREKVVKRKRNKKAPAPEPPDKRIVNLAIFALILFIFIPNLSSSIDYVTSAKFNDQGVKPWEDAGEWIKQNTPENALLFHWWDYGYHLQTFAERRTIVDGGHVWPPLPPVGDPNRNIDVATMFTSTEEKALEIIKLYNPEDRPVYVLVSIEEFGKSGAINYHVNDQLFITSFTVPNSGNPGQDQKTISDILTRSQITTYYVINYGSHYQIWALIQFDQQGNYHPEWSEKLLAKLLPFNTGYGQGLKHFQMVYQNGYVYVYKYIP